MAGMDRNCMYASAQCWRTPVNRAEPPIWTDPGLLCNVVGDRAAAWRRDEDLRGPATPAADVVRAAYSSDSSSSPTSYGMAHIRQSSGYSES